MSWPVVTLREACDLVTDGTHYTPENIGEGVPFLTVKDVSLRGLDFHACARISEHDFLVAQAGNSAPRRGDVLFSKDGTVGKVHVVQTDERFAVLSSLAILRPAPNVDPAYLGRVLQTPAVLEEAVSRKSGSAIRRIILSDLKNVKFALPPVSEQRRIAAILNAADAIRAKRRAQLAHLDDLPQALFREMFAHEEPNAELAGICTKITDGTHQSPTWAGSGVPFIFISNISSGEIHLATDKFISDQTWSELTRRTPIEVGDILYSTVGSFGIPAIVRSSRKFAFQRHIAHIKPDRALVDSEFLAAQLRSNDVLRQARSNARGIAQPTLNLGDIKRFRVAVPPLPLQREFAAKVDAIHAERARVARALEADDELFAALQHRAFRGEL